MKNELKDKERVIKELSDQVKLMEKMKKVETDREREKKMMKRKGRNTEMDWGEGVIGVGALKKLDIRVEGFKDRLHTKRK